MLVCQRTLSPCILSRSVAHEQISHRLRSPCKGQTSPSSAVSKCRSCCSTTGVIHFPSSSQKISLPPPREDLSARKKKPRLTSLLWDLCSLPGKITTVFSNPGYSVTSCKFRLFVAAGIFYTLAWGISTWIITLTRCHPIALAYDWTLIQQQRQAVLLEDVVDLGQGPTYYCRDPVLLSAIIAIFSLVGDLYIIVLPLPKLMRLDLLGARKKAAVIGIFLLGSL